VEWNPPVFTVFNVDKASILVSSRKVVIGIYHSYIIAASARVE
jgi:hypothetical protein